jgi:hypothetical protein
MKEKTDRYKFVALILKKIQESGRKKEIYHLCAISSDFAGHR